MKTEKETLLFSERSLREVAMMPISAQQWRVAVGKMNANKRCREKRQKSSSEAPCEGTPKKTEREGREAGTRRESSDCFVRLFPGVEVARFRSVSECTRRKRRVDQENERDREGSAGIAGYAATSLAVHHCSTATDGGRRGAKPWPAQER